MLKYLVLVSIALVVSSRIAIAQPATQAAKASATTTQAIDDDTPTEADTVGEIFGNSRVGQLVQGRRKVSIDDVKDPAFWLDTARDLIFAILVFIPRFIVATLFLGFFWMVYRTIRKLVLGSMARASVDESIREMLGHLIKWTIMGFGLVVACNQIGIEITALLTAAGVIGLAVGFAAQETLANFIAGIVIFWDKPFRPGDWVEVDQTYGQVKRVTFRSTRILDFSGQMIVYPNTYMLANRVSNHTTYPLTRVAVPIGIAYKESIDDARQTMLGTVKGDARISADPAPEVIVKECGDSSVNLQLRFWIVDEALERVIVLEYVEKCKKAFDAAGISIPYPHMQLFVEETAAIGQLAGGLLRKAG